MSATAPVFNLFLSLHKIGCFSYLTLHPQWRRVLLCAATVSRLRAHLRQRQWFDHLIDYLKALYFLKAELDQRLFADAAEQCKNELFLYQCILCSFQTYK